MYLYPPALAQAAAVFMFCIALINSSINLIYFKLNVVQLVVPLFFTPLIAAVAGYAFGRLYNYFVISHKNSGNQ